MLQKPKAIVLDIEGTTTPIDFVYRTLFPYARERIPAWAASHADTPAIAELRMEYENDSSPLRPGWEAARYLLWLMDQDRKSPALKSIQGRIWEAGYTSGALKGDLFPDVVPALRRFRQEERSVFIYSSGSVLAQRLLFSFSIEGDLTDLVNGYFDTAVGPKTEKDSYLRIISSIELAAAQCLFVSDAVKELDAATAAGMQVLHSIRPGNKDAPGQHASIRSFDEIP